MQTLRAPAWGMAMPAIAGLAALEADRLLLRRCKQNQLHIDFHFHLVAKTTRAEPPALAKRFVSYWVKEGQKEAVLGDLEEMFCDAIQNGSSLGHAKRLYWAEVRQTLGPLAKQRITHFVKSVTRKLRGSA